MAENDSHYRFDSIDLAVYIWKKRIPLLIITVVAAVVSIIASLMIVPRFRSSVVIFPRSEASVSKSMLQLNYQLDIQAVGEEEQVEEIMQVLKSDKIRDRIIDKYDLMSHYNIDPESRYPLYKLHSYYESNVRVKRTEFNSIVVSVLDADPQMAADMANDIAVLVDTTIWEMKSQRARQAVTYLDQEMDSINQELEELKDCIHSYNVKGLINYDRQIERMIEAYGKAIVEGNNQAMEKIEEEMYYLGDYTSEYMYCVGRYTFELRRLSEIKDVYLQVKAALDSHVSNIFILDKAYKADKKAYPNKSLIVIVSTLSAFVLALLAFLFFEKFMKRIRSA
jgi:tyrosine-protein kinase Etk/Wzc